MALIKCDECGKDISSKAPSCPGCGAPVGSAAEPSAFQAAGGSARAVVAATNQGAQETTFYTDQNGVRITNARAILANRTYSMANLTTVTVGLTVPTKGAPLALIIVGVIVFLGAVSNQSGGGIAVGLLMAIAGGLWFKSLKDIYHVRIGSAGGESNALSSINRQYIEGVAGALNEAIVMRG